MDMQWWHWAVLGLVLGLLELATPGGFFILFFGVGALAGQHPLAARDRRSAVAAVGAVRGPVRHHLFFFRDPLLRRMRASEHTGAIDSLTADIAVAKEDILPGAFGRAELRGTSWSALNVGLAAPWGQRCGSGRWTG